MHIEGIDEIDNRILDVIAKDARMSYSEIGERVNLSRVTVKNRMEMMEAQGIIKGYETIINPTAAIEGTKFLIDVITEPDAFNRVVDLIAKSDIICKVYAVTGESRFRAEGFASNRSKLESLMVSIKNNSTGIVNCTTQIVLYTIKDVYEGVDYVGAIHSKK